MVHIKNLKLLFLTLILGLAITLTATNNSQAEWYEEPEAIENNPDGFSINELVLAGHNFFGTATEGLGVTLETLYNMDKISDVHKRFPGTNGTAYVVGGLGGSVYNRSGTTIASIKTGVGLRMGANIGYIKFSKNPKWLPF
jgi:hypothetical protein